MTVLVVKTIVTAIAAAIIKGLLSLREEDKK